jgi:hypothetical protein
VKNLLPPIDWDFPQGIQRPIPATWLAGKIPQPHDAARIRGSQPETCGAG